MRKEDIDRRLNEDEHLREREALSSGPLAVRCFRAASHRTQQQWQLLQLRQVLQMWQQLRQLYRR